MTAIRYIARRSISPTHTQGVEYTFSFFSKRLDPLHRTVRNESVAINGNTQTRVERREELWTIETNVLEEDTDDYSVFLEFMDSVDNFEHFFVDLNPGILTPLFRRTLLTRNYRRRRHEQENAFSFSFDIRILP